MKSLVNYALLKEQLKRFWPIAALATLWYVLFAVSPQWSTMSDSEAMLAVQGIIRIITMRNPIIQVAGVVVPFAAAISIFSYLFTPKSTAAMHSYPVNKKQLYFTNAAAGLVLIAVPLLILCACLLTPVAWQLPDMRLDPQTGERIFNGYMADLPVELFPNGLANGAVVNTFPVVAGFFGRALLTNVFFFAVFAASVMLAGNAVVSMLICGFLPFIPCLILILGYLTGQFFFFGFGEYMFEEALTQVFTFTNPEMLAATFNFYYPQYPEQAVPAASNMLIYYGVYMLIAAGLLAVSYWCSCVRRQERAGDSVVFTPVRNVLIFLLSTGGMIFIGAFFLGVFKSVALMYAGFVLGFIIAYFIAQMIAEKTFNVLYKVKDIVKYGGVMAGLMVVIVLVARLDLFGFQTYSPDAGEVYGVYLYQPYTMNNYTGEEQPDDYKHGFFVTDERILADTLTLHNRIIVDRHSLRSVFLSSLEGGTYEKGISEQYFIYLLKNGTYVSRSYMLMDDYAQSAGLTALLSEENVILSQYRSFKSPEKIDRINLQYNSYTEKVDEYAEKLEPAEYYEPVYIEEPAEITSVLKEIEKDIVLTRRKQLSAGKLDNVQWSGGISGYTEVDVRNGTRSVDHFSLDSCENVDKWLESRGLKPENAQLPQN